MRLIDALILKGAIDLALQSIKIFQDSNWLQGYAAALRAMLELIDKCDTIEAEPAKHGRWEERDRSGIAIRGFMVCSCCDAMLPVPSISRYCLHRLNYCPNCGAKMDAEDEE